MFSNNLIAGSAGQGGFYPKTIEGSLRFNDDDSAYLFNSNFLTPTDNQNWTWSSWIKLSTISTAARVLFQADTNSVDVLQMIDYKLSVTISGATTTSTTMLLRDPSAWYHIVWNYNGSNSKLYVNGELQVTVSKTGNTKINNASYTHYIGTNSTGRYFDGYLAEVHFTDGTAYDADAFGELKNGVWVAKTPEVTYGTNGFHLPFTDDTEVEAFNTVLWRGNGATQSITGMGFEPDLVWIKERSSTSGHSLFDQIRGATNYLSSHSTAAEATSTVQLTSFDSDGFTVGSSGGVNESGQTYVAWGWKAGDSNVSNTDGSITSTVRANDTYGFSIVSYTGAGIGTNSTVGHGLSQAPNFIVVKDRDSGARGWIVYHSSLGASSKLALESTDAVVSSSAYWTGTEPTSTVFGVGTGGDTNTTDDYIAYCWAEKSGYSKIGSYEGNNTATGPTVTTTFKPAFVMIKNADGTGNWNIFDNTRATFPDNDLFLRANLSAAEVDGSGEGGDAYEVEFTDTGFIPKASGASSRSQVNGTGTYIYAAFADTREAAFWLDQSGNDNDWQPENLDHNDTVADSPTDNFATLNPLDKLGSPTLSDGNLKLVLTNGVDQYIRGTHGINSGKWYWEVTCGSLGSNAGIAINPITTSITAGSGAQFTGAYAYEADGRKRIGITASSYGASYTSGDVIGVAVDFDALEIEFYKNNVSQGAISISEGTYLPASSTGGAATSTFTYNFGQQPFKYDPPA